MAKKAEESGEKIPRWELKVDYVESCNCNFGCPCNFSGYPTDGHCEALVGYHVRQGHFGRTRLDGRANVPKGFIFRSAQAARTLVMKILGSGPLSFDHAGRNAFYARLDFQGP